MIGPVWPPCDSVIYVHFQLHIVDNNLQFIEVMVLRNIDLKKYSEESKWEN